MKKLEILWSWSWEAPRQQKIAQLTRHPLTWLSVSVSCRLKIFSTFFLIFSHTNNLKKAQQLLKSHEFNEKYQKFHLSILIFMLFHFFPQLLLSHALWREENQNFPTQISLLLETDENSFFSAQFSPNSPSFVHENLPIFPFFFLASPRRDKRIFLGPDSGLRPKDDDLILLLARFCVCAGDKMYNSNGWWAQAQKMLPRREKLSILWLRPCRPSGGESENNYKREFNFHAEQQIDELSLEWNYQKARAREDEKLRINKGKVERRRRRRMEKVREMANSTRTRHN